jgi:uncharacterized protein YbjQ (UPF0145 family)
MGRVTEDITRLVGEIQGGRRDRQQMMQDLRRNAIERKRDVKKMKAGFHAAHAEMSRRQKKALRDFAKGIEDEVCGLLKDFAGDLAGARRAWKGTTSLELTSRRTGAAKLEYSVLQAEAAEAKPPKAAAQPALGVMGLRSARKQKKHRA